MEYLTRTQHKAYVLDIPTRNLSPLPKDIDRLYRGSISYDLLDLLSTLQISDGVVIIETSTPINKRVNSVMHTHLNRKAKKREVTTKDMLVFRDRANGFIADYIEAIVKAIYSALEGIPFPKGDYMVSGYRPLFIDLYIITIAPIFRPLDNYLKEGGVHVR